MTSRPLRRVLLVLAILSVLLAMIQLIRSGPFGRGAGRGVVLPSSPAIVIVPLGRVPTEELEEVRRALVDGYGLQVTLAPETGLPADAFYPPRQRYRARPLLDFLAAMPLPEFDRVIGVTAEDISIPTERYPDWGIFGLAHCPGRAAVVSTFRLGRHGRDARHRLERLGKVAVHEAGHTFGLLHCARDACLMRSPDGQVRVVDETRSLCDDCRGQLLAAGMSLPGEDRSSP